MLAGFGGMLVPIAIFLGFNVGQTHLGSRPGPMSRFGAVALGWYNSLVRHDHVTDAPRDPWRSKRAAAVSAEPS